MFNKRKFISVGSLFTKTKILDLSGRAASENMSPKKGQEYYLTVTPAVTGCSNPMECVSCTLYTIM